MVALFPLGTGVGVEYIVDLLYKSRGHKAYSHTPRVLSLGTAEALCGYAL